MSSEPVTITHAAPPCERCGVTIPPHGPDLAERRAEAAGWRSIRQFGFVQPVLARREDSTVMAAINASSPPGGSAWPRCR
jgi:hypothetical protein